MKIKLALLFLFLIYLSGCTKQCQNIKKRRCFNSCKDFFCINQDIESIPTQLTLDEIICIAMERNFDLRIKCKEWEAMMNRAMGEKLKMLPSLISNGELSNRNNNLIVASESVDPLIPPAPPSISTERHVKRYDVTLVYNLLDFGLAYYRGRQESNRAFMTQMEYCRIVHQLVVDLTEQYWGTIAAKAALEGGKQLLIQAQSFQEKINQQMEESILSKTKGLKNESDLIALQLQLRRFAKDYHQALSELALSMGLPPNFEFEVVEEPICMEKVEVGDIFSLEETALRLRPELYSADSEEEIAEDEVRTAFLQMIPGIELFGGDYYDANRFYTFNHWLIAGARATWDLFTLPSQYRFGKSAMRQKEVAKLQRMATSVAVLSQVRLAHILYQDYYDEFELSRQLEEANEKLLQASIEEYDEGVISGTELLAVQSKALLSEVNAIKAYGALQVSLEELNSSIGLPRYYKSCLDIKEGDLCLID